MMDHLIGGYTGRLLSPLATLDLVGLDIYKAIIENLYNNTNDEMHESFTLPNYVNKMIDNGLLGNKTKQGFYKKLESGKYSCFDPATSDYIPSIYPHIGFIEKAKHFVHMGLYRDAFDVISKSTNPEVSILMNTLCMYVSYSFNLIGEATELNDGIEGIDKVMSYGFNWAPPSVILSLLGGKDKVSDMLLERELKVPDWPESLPDQSAYLLGEGRYFVAK